MPADTNATTTFAARPGAQNRALDEALDASFPASDPVAMLEPSAPSPDRPVVETEVQARQGVTGHNVRYVLGYGLAGIIVAFVVLYLLMYSA